MIDSAQWHIEEEMKMQNRTIWTLTGENCEVEVVVHKTESERIWCLYAVLNKNHPLFSKYSHVQGMDDLKNHFDYEFHGGITFLERVYDSYGIFTAVKVGCDYNRVDDYFYRKPENVFQVLTQLLLEAKTLLEVIS